MENIKSFTNILVQLTLVVSIMLLSGCSGTQLKLEPLVVSDRPTEAITTLETDLAAAVQEQLNVLSPEWFGKAERSLAEAQTIMKEKGELGKLGQSVAKGHAELKKAKEFARTARVAIADAIKARDMARTAGATSFGEEYADIEDDFLELTRKIEDNNLGYAQKNQQKVATLFHAIEVKAIKEHTLGEVRNLIREAEEAGAIKVASGMLKDVKAELMAVDAFITTNPYAKEDMRTKAAASRFNAARLVQLVKQARVVEKMAPIEVSLWVEKILKDAGDKLGVSDMRDRSFDTQSANVLESISSVGSDRNFLAEQAKVQKAEITTMLEKHPAEIAQLKEQCDSEVSQIKIQNDSDRAALQDRYEVEISALVKQVATLEGKNRAEAEKFEKLMAEKRAERERLEAEKRSEQVRQEAENRAEQGRLEAERLAVENKLELERRFSKQYQDASSLFSPDEAECYKQGQQMVIRLRSMNFPVGQAVIMPNNYPLLSKVQRAVRIFAEPGVVIEGHTDSTGSPETNNLLSQQRAEAVRQYLLANAVAKEEQVVAAGFGATRPLSPNTTAEGRAVNRRIDVVITPISIATP
ncbi:MAG: OmpA family protein [Proteobacteria bacterium]|nr:OmpA family protein [Pseudomonadota bacterium]MBU1687563.1 OmpA family protein [Pseudomonadota bacterium]